jgi:hypothetical protein
MFRTLLGSPEVKARIAQLTNGFDFERTFETKIGISLEQWLFVVFAAYAYFLNIGSVIDPDPAFMMINPKTFRGESGITEKQLGSVLAFVSAQPSAIYRQLSRAQNTDARYDFVEFRSTPFIELEYTKLLPTDITFILDKCHSGVQWALHDALPSKKERDLLFTAWGVLFEEYVHWLLKGMKTNLPLTYFPSPKWKKSNNESFDGILLKGPVLMPAEYKGGFLARSARYSGRSSSLLAELDKKLAVGCRQLAQKIGAAFADDIRDRRELEDLDCGQVRVVVPLLVFQDHFLRGPGVNWYLNRRFQEFLAQQKMRSDIIVRPLTVLSIDDLESIIHATECQDFDFIYALHNRAVRDQEGLSDVLDWLRQFPDFRSKSSPRIARVFENATKEITSFLFPRAASQS